MYLKFDHFYPEDHEGTWGHLQQMLGIRILFCTSSSQTNLFMSLLSSTSQWSFAEEAINIFHLLFSRNLLKKQQAGLIQHTLHLVHTWLHVPDQLHPRSSALSSLVEMRSGRCYLPVSSSSCPSCSFLVRMTSILVSKEQCKSSSYDLHCSFKKWLYFCSPSHTFQWFCCQPFNNPKGLGNREPGPQPLLWPPSTFFFPLSPSWGD